MVAEYLGRVGPDYKTNLKIILLTCFEARCLLIYKSKIRTLKVGIGICIESLLKFLIAENVKSRHFICRSS